MTPRSIAGIAGSMATLSLCVAAAAQPKDDRPLPQRAYLGLSVRDTGDGPVVGWINPGPLGGEGTQSKSGAKRGDNVVSVNGRAIADAAAFIAAMRALNPGDPVTLVLRRSPQAKSDDALPIGGPGGDEATYSLTTATADEWTGTVTRGLASRAIPDPAEGAFEKMILERAGALGVRAGDNGIGGGLDALLAYLARTQNDALDSNALPAVVQTFRRPLSVDAVEAGIAARARAAASGDFDDIAALVRFVLDLPAATTGRAPSLNAGMDMATLRDRARSLVRRMREDVSLGGDDTRDHLSVLRASPAVVESVLPFMISIHPTMAEFEDLGRIHSRHGPTTDIPPEVRAAVEGDILYVIRFPNGTTGVVGGPGKNTYRIGPIADVYDAGGDDTYLFEPADATPSAGNHHLIDLAGNDTYTASGDFCGPGVGILSMSIVDDRTGNDIYRSSGQFSIGAGLFGIGLILDGAGDDLYENLGKDSGWSMGVGYYGAGLIIDRGGSDAYHAEYLSQGVGGPRGFGAIIDAAGDDSYKTNGPDFPSVYGTPGVFACFSQGFGYGIRGYASGGVGAIYDLSGADSYEAGEFGQAGGYYWGLGVMHDAEGNDRYVGNRYGQAFAAHQAAGILVDDAGDDEYRSMTAASQAGTWDQSIGVLLDRAGNDRYTCDGLGQGAAAMQALAVLLDLAGDDTYKSAGGSTQGESGGNSYHYDADKVFSFSALFDLGGGKDTYSTGRENGKTVRTGAYNMSAPADSSLYGVFSDE